MNRIIKFRGKRFDNGEWVYGDLLHIANGTLIYHGSDTDYDKSSDDRIAVGLYNDEVSVVIPKTVGQFTGMLDRNGKEIYEGDIINWLSFTFGGQGFVEEGRVEWRQVEGCYVVVNRIETKDGRESIQLLIRCTRDLKVVGNIYDNPELLKGGKR